ncbi:hypothetical protein E2C01_067405 [Portunus trituberculatus]|uniref:Uncharacterized protein n=1 Tax=Portunus trituberculatus TaxID=210409 RepID=A0A5B7HUY3_PORTR|nr:hypothetical protein [Portunus trituberculatus]
MLMVMMGTDGEGEDGRMGGKNALHTLTCEAKALALSEHDKQQVSITQQHSGRLMAASNSNVTPSE